MHDEPDASDAVRRARGESVGGSLDDIAFAPGLAKVTRASEMRQLYGEAMEPVWRAVEEDAGALEAARKLRAMVSVDRAVPKKDSSIRPFTSPGGGAPFNVTPGTTVFRKPYDYEKTSKQGDPPTLAADPVGGTFSVNVDPPLDWDGPLGGYSAIGLGLETNQPGIVSIRPMVSYWDRYYAGGFLLSATTIGHLGYYVEADGGPAVSNIQDVQLWNSGDTGGQHLADSGWVGGWYNEVHFKAEANRPYAVWFWVHAWGDQSGERTFSGSYMRGNIEADVNWVMVELS